MAPLLLVLVSYNLKKVFNIVLLLRPRSSLIDK